MARHLYFKQDVLATIVITDTNDNGAALDAASSRAGKGTGSGVREAKLLKGNSSSSSSVLLRPLQERACTPRRPPYAADLRDANLAAHNVLPNQIVNSTTGA
jgi:hypothetical protein